MFLRFERKYDPVAVRDWMAANPWCPILAVVLYGIFIGLGKYHFNGRPAWNWRNSMALWNLGLSIFSFIGLLRTGPQLLHNLLNYSITENLCFDPESHFGSGATGFWVQIFCLSKFP
jgi:elongation of very long chain fatty acids protein 6